MIKDTTKIKENIIEFLKINGPSLPVHIGKSVGMDILFISAFLSELFRENKIKISKMRVGTSPIYYLGGTENQLEKYSEHLNFKEREAHNLLKQNKFLMNEIQHPAIQVALKSIPDFAKSFESENKLIWRYFIIPENEYFPKQKEIKPIQSPPKIISESEEDLPEEKKKTKEIEEKPKIKIEKKKIIPKKTNQKKNDKFFNTVKEYLASKQIEIIDIERFSKDDLMLRVKINEKEKILIAYNKKRISEEEITKAHKKSKETGLRYMILSFGEPLKKTNAFIEAIKELDNISKIE